MTFKFSRVQYHYSLVFPINLTPFASSFRQWPNALASSILCPLHPPNLTLLGGIHLLASHLFSRCFLLD
jgi:hypothetical protein